VLASWNALWYPGGGFAAAAVDYLGRVRGVSAHIDQDMVTNGFSHSVTVTTTVLERLGHDLGVLTSIHSAALVLVRGCSSIGYPRSPVM
jgi:hypothetical protein